MSEQCNPTFDRIAGALGDFSCQDAPAVVHLRNPLDLSNGTLPVLELMMVFGAAFALWYAIRRLRRQGDPMNLALWVATVIYLFVIEVPLYFPNVFGIEDQLGVLFVHNVFTVQFLFERLPLYIVALYPAVVMLAYEIVRSLGVFRDRGIIVGAVCVGFVHQCFYEVFDQLGPQLRWWAWNSDNNLNHPMFASVPMTSMSIFATLGPIVVTVLVMLLVGRKAQRDGAFGGVSLSWRIVVIGVLVPVGIGILSTPTSLFGGDNPNTTAQAIVFSLELGVVAVIALSVLIPQCNRARRDGGGAIPNEFVRVFGPIYLLVLAALWKSALPDYFSASDGVTTDGTPIGSLLYASVCFVVAAALVVVTSFAVTSFANRSDTDEQLPTHAEPPCGERGVPPHR